MIREPVTPDSHDGHCIDVAVLITGDGVNVAATFEFEVTTHFSFIFVVGVPADHTSDRESFSQELMVLEVHTSETHFTRKIVHFAKRGRHLVVQVQHLSFYQWA